MAYPRPLKQPTLVGTTIQAAASYVGGFLRRDDADTKTFLDIKATLKELHPYILEKEDITFFLCFFDGVTQSSAPAGRNGTIICDLR